MEAQGNKKREMHTQRRHGKKEEGGYEKRGKIAYMKENREERGQEREKKNSWDKNEKRREKVN